VFLTSEGLTTYEAKELGLAELKLEKWDFDRSVTVTAVEQDEFFKVVYTALAQLRPNVAHKFVHVPHGMMVLTTGKMSSRKGNVVTGEDMLENMLALTREKVADRDLSDEEKESIARAVAVSAIKYSVLKQKTGKNITFDPDSALSFEGDSGPYLQYAHTRAVSVLEKAHAMGVTPSTELAPREATPLERLLYRFPEVVLRARETHEPHYVTSYLTELASVWNSWYAHEKILDDSLTTPYKLAVVRAFATTMQNGLYVLGIEAPRKM
jgi:arginyl-tRNA synthetase